MWFPPPLQNSIRLRLGISMASSFSDHPSLIPYPRLSIRQMVRSVFTHPNSRLPHETVEPSGAFWSSSFTPRRPLCGKEMIGQGNGTAGKEGRRGVCDGLQWLRLGASVDGGWVGPEMGLSSGSAERKKWHSLSRLCGLEQGWGPGVQTRVGKKIPRFFWQRNDRAGEWNG